MTFTTYEVIPPRWKPPWHGEGAYLTRTFQPVHQQEELVGVIAATFDENKQILLRQGLDSVLKFAVTLAFPS